MVHIKSTSVGLLLFVAICSVDARHLRVNRNAAQVEGDEPEIEVAEVLEVKPTGYPPAGQRPGRAFPLPGEEEGLSTTTAAPLDLTTTTDATEVELASTTLFNEVPAELLGDDQAAERSVPKAPYPAAGYRPRVAFNLPTERVEKANASDVTSTTALPVEEAQTTTTVTPLGDTTTVVELSTTTKPALRKAPYPAAGFRPYRVFLLPTELESANQTKTTNDTVAAGNANHPACGVSTNPLHPAPAAGAVDEPDAERVLVTATARPTVISAAGPRVSPYRPVLQVQAPQILAQPVVYTIPGRPFAYSAQFQTW